MQAAHRQFKANIARVSELGAIASRVGSLTGGVLDLSDILRAQIVLAVSAFDTLIHDLSRIGMIEAANGKRPVTDAMKRYVVSLEAALSAATGPGFAWLEQEIRSRNGLLTFQRPDKVADALRNVSSTPLWPAVAGRLGTTVEDVKSELEVVVDRRNKIAHEADADPTFLGQRWPITPTQVRDAVDFLERVGDAIFETVK